MSEYVYLPHVCKLWKTLVWKHARWGFDVRELKRLNEQDQAHMEAAGERCTYPPCSIKTHPFCAVHLPTRSCNCCGKACSKLHEDYSSCDNLMWRAFLSHSEMAMNEAPMPHNSDYCSCPALPASLVVL